MQYKEYIEREVAIKAVCNSMPHICRLDDCGKGCQEVSAIISIPAADVRSVVLCRDCKHWELSKIKPSFHVCTYLCGVSFVRNAEDFCSRGEKREKS